MIVRWWLKVWTLTTAVVSPADENWSMSLVLGSRIGERGRRSMLGTLWMTARGLEPDQAGLNYHQSVNRV